ncbi:hypothetical protein SASPL_130973 [Salvia splendens]|uniref:Uncharacterized protein n=1 Tax=Salvia splendens TaxID=180675 RepID=A0A8X8ZJX2_SALSN|nr:hypothetical protein SASPL_130973 [Salvia splendens]
MTHNAGHGDLRLVGDYVKLEVGVGGGGGGGGAQCLKAVSPSCGGGGEWRWLLWWWAKLLLVSLFIAVLLAVFLKWIGPFVMYKVRFFLIWVFANECIHLFLYEKNVLVFGLMDWSLLYVSVNADALLCHIPLTMAKEIIPLINWERESFSTKHLALLIFASLTIFPSVLLPSSPSMWLAGMTFGYGYGFLLVVGGVIFGLWLERYPKRASVIRLAGEGSVFNQFRAVALIRISPFPYIIYNYCAVATDVKFGPYLLGTLVGMVPEIFLTLYTGIIIQTLADATDYQRTMSGSQILFNIGGFCITAAATVLVTLYAKKRLKELQMEEVLVLQ